MTVTDGAYIAVLEQKLVQSERSLYEFRRIFEHWTRGTGKEMASRVVEESYEGDYILQPTDEECTD